MARCKECHKPWGEPLSPNNDYWSNNEHNRPNREQGCSLDGKHVMQRID